MLLEHDILAIATEEELMQIRVEDIGERRMTPAEWTHLLKLAQAYWQHNGDPQAPHALLVSHGGKPGNHSDGFVNALTLLSYTNICTIVATQLKMVVDAAMAAAGITVRPKWVAGSDHAGADFSHEYARLEGVRHDFNAKGPENSQVWDRFEIGPDEWVLQVEELSTDLKTPLAVRRGIIAGHSHPVRFIPFLGLFVSRCPRTEFEGGPVISLVHYNMRSWTPEECATSGLCAQGSEAIKPKKPKGNWQRLVSGR